MAASTSGYDTGVRSALNQRGITNDRISYDPTKGVMVDQVSFMRPDKVYGGSAFTNQGNFNQAWDAYNKANQSNKQVQGGVPAGYGAAYQPTARPVTGATLQSAGVGSRQQPTYTPPQTGYTQPTTGYQQQQTPSIDQRVADLYAYAQNQQAFDPYSAPAYAAAQAQAQRAAQQGIRQAQEAYGQAGFSRSTALGERAQRIGQEGTEYLMTQVIPQIQAQEQARRQQEFQNLFSLLTPQQQQQQFAEQTAQSRAGLTGSFLAPEAQNTINQLLALKQQAEAPTITREGRAGLSSQADVLRSQLAAMGVDPTAFGAGRTAAQATGAMPTAGVQTLQGQAQQFEQAATTRQLDRADFESDRQFEFAKGQQQWENNFQTGQFNWQKAQQAWENTFKEKDFQQQMNEAAASRGLQWASLNQRQKETIADNAFREKQFQYQKEQDALAQKAGGAGATGDYTTDPSFAEDISWINQNPGDALAEIQSNDKALIAQYGYKGYQELLKAAGG